MGKLKASPALCHIELTQLPKLSSGLVYAVLFLFLFFAQTTDLVHTHDGELSKQVDCEICLKLGSTGDAIIALSADFSVNSFVPFFPALHDQLFSAAILAPRSRAPPQT